MVLLLLIINSWKTITFLSDGVTVTCVLTLSFLHFVYFPLTCCLHLVPPP